MDRALDQFEAFEAGIPAEVIAEAVSLQNAARRYAIWFLLKARRKAERHPEYRHDLMRNALVGVAACSLCSLLSEKGSTEAELDQLLGQVRGLTPKVRDLIRDDLRSSR